MKTHKPPVNHVDLKEHLAALQLSGLLAHWDQLDEQQIEFCRPAC